MEDTSYSEDLKIDIHDLHKEWVNQPSLFMKWAEKYANAVLARDKCRQKLDLKYGDIDLEVRMNPIDFGIDKLTEASIKSAIVMSDRYQLCQDDYLESTRDMNVMSGAKTALEQRKVALDNITKLHLSGYYQTETNIPMEAQAEDRGKVKKATSKTLEEKLKKRRKLKRVGRPT